MQHTNLHGYLDSRFAPLGEIMGENLQSGVETGLSLVVEIDGHSVVNAYGGYADAARTRPWGPDTIVNVWSTTKTVVSLAILVLADRGLVDLDASVATYWPEFAQSGKDSVLIRHVMSHTSGVSGWETPFAISDMYDLERSTARLAAQRPWWEPGTASAYHAHTFGHLLGEVVRRVTGMRLTEFVREELALPLGADFQIGASVADWPRCAEILSTSVTYDVGDDVDSVPVKTLRGTDPNPFVANTAEWRQAEIGAANGHGNAASVARILSPIVMDGVSRGVKLLSRGTIEQIFREQAHGIDLFLGIPMRWGIGFALPEPAGVSFVPEGEICYWGGGGGSMIILDLERRMTISYMMNKMQPPNSIGSEVAASYCNIIYDLVGH